MFFFYNCNRDNNLTKMKPNDSVLFYNQSTKNKRTHIFICHCKVFHKAEVDVPYENDHTVEVERSVVATSVDFLVIVLVSNSILEVDLCVHKLAEELEQLLDLRTNENIVLIK